MYLCIAFSFLVGKQRETQSINAKLFRFYAFVGQPLSKQLYIPALRGGLVSAQFTAFPTVDLHVLSVTFISVPAVSHIRPQIAKTDSVPAVAYHGMT